jgi:hypothetical protein
MRGARHGIGLLLIVAAVGFASCREPTQIKLELSTDADCPDQPGRPRLNDVVILTSKVIEVGTPGNPKPAPPVNAETDMCSGSGSYKTVGSLVLLPDGSDNPTVDVLIAAGVQRDETDDTANSMTAGQCAGLVFEGSSIEGLPCIIARRAPHLRRPQVATAPDRARQGVYRRRLRGRPDLLPRQLRQP